MKNLAYGSIVFGFIAMVFFTWLFLTRTTGVHFGGNIDSNVWSQYGSIIGGFSGALFSLAGVLLLIKNLQQQEEYFDKQQFESRFFELIKIHRENVDQISIQHRLGRKVFTTLLRELNDILVIVLAQSEGIPVALVNG